MVGAICPKCKIVVVQTDGAGNGLEVGLGVPDQAKLPAIGNVVGAAAS